MKTDRRSFLGSAAAFLSFGFIGKDITPKPKQFTDHIYVGMDLGTRKGDSSKFSVWTGDKKVAEDVLSEFKITKDQRKLIYKRMGEYQKSYRGFLA